ncbi:MAG: YbhB/YbcL family Raf kinase inhibitor-like protein [Candidatus Magasanikbacteria bacterium]
MKLTSPAFNQEGEIPEKFTCDGEDINPRLEISETPERAKSLALIVEDPDAPGGTFTHWTVWNIDPDVGAIEEDETPEGAIEGSTDFGSIGYGGPCPPSGTHRYFFKLYALEEEINLEAGAGKSDLETAIKERVIDSSELMGKYSRE